MSCIMYANGLLSRADGVFAPYNLDFVPFWTARDLESKLLSFKEFNNDQRCHFALDGDTPSDKTGKIRPKVADLNAYRWRSHC